MRLLWTVNVPLPAAAAALGLPPSPFGGWLSTMTQQLAQVPGLELGVVMRAPVAQVQQVNVDGICYYALPQVGKGGLDARAEDCQRILAEFQPDLLHAEGSEMAYTQRMLAAWRGPRLLSLQGVINGIEPYQLGGLRFWKLLASMRPRQMLTAFALAANKTLRFNPRLLSERETLLLANHIMGRTPWDQAQAWAFNPQARYHHCSRTLRQPFYQFRWQPEAISRYTLFAGNAAVPLKGVHYLLEALALLRREFPEVRLIVAGEAPGTQASRFKRLVGYSAFLLDRIEQLGLQDCVTFTGLLDAEKMAAQMARCHAYVMGSLIENSPNTLAEAMLLGMPCAVGYAGGAPGMAQDEHEALFFRAGDPVTMAFQIKRLFNSDALCMQLSEAARARALKAHNPEANLQDLLRAYSVILENGAGDGG